LNTAAFPNEPTNLQVALNRYSSAIRTINGSTLARILLRARSDATITAALDAVPGLCQEVQSLRAVLELARLDHANLVAAARSALIAERDGEPDPMWYIRDELAGRGQFPGPHGGTGASW
jgi:phage tail protein X